MEVAPRALTSATSFHPIIDKSTQQLLPLIQHVYETSTYDDYVALAIIFVGAVCYATRKQWWNPVDPYHHIWFVRPQADLAAGLEKQRASRNVAQKMIEADKDIVLFWGSQSGTSEGFATRLAKELELRFGAKTLLADLSDYDHEHLAALPKSKLAFFLLSTFGEGDPSDNTQGLWDTMESMVESSPSDHLKNLRYFAFGFGNSDYKHYNRVIDVVDSRLQKLDAVRIGNVGRADDRTGGTEEDFLAWKESVFKIFKEQLGYQESEMVYEPSLQVEELSTIPEDLKIGEPNQSFESRKAGATYSQVNALPVVNSRELFTTPSRSCLHMEIDLTSVPKIKYSTGDHLAVWPINPDVEVERMLAVLGLNSKKSVPIKITSLEATNKVPIPSPTTREALFRYYLEICAPIHRDTLTLLAAYAPTPAAKLFLNRVGNNKNEFRELVASRPLNLARLLTLAAPGETWAAVPLSFLIENLPKLQPRYYSISSSAVVAPRCPSITVVVSSQQLGNPVETPNGDNLLHGVTTNYLLALKQSLSAVPSPHPHGLSYALEGPNNVLNGGKLHVHVRKSKFKLPMNTAHPIVLVGAGTGIAPFRGFLQERARVKQLGRPVGPILLFFGCRNPNEDFLYKEEWQEFKGQLKDAFEMVTAFSRLPGQKKVYVQDRVVEYRSRVRELVVDGAANVYLCGSAAMARSVGFKLQEILEGSGVDLENMKKMGRLQEDVWG